MSLQDDFVQLLTNDMTPFVKTEDNGADRLTSWLLTQCVSCANLFLTIDRHVMVYFQALGLGGDEEALSCTLPGFLSTKIWRVV